MGSKSLTTAWHRLDRADWEVVGEAILEYT
jgi:hypothetical protein